MILHAASPFVFLKFGEGRVGLSDADSGVMPSAKTIDDSSRNYEDCRLIGNCRRKRIDLETVLDLLSPKDRIGEFPRG